MQTSYDLLLRQNDFFSLVGRRDSDALLPELTNESLDSDVCAHTELCYNTHTETCYRDKCAAMIMEKAYTTIAMLIMSSGQDAQNEQGRIKRLYKPRQFSVIMDT
jgi:hypothetical protein